MEQDGGGWGRGGGGGGSGTPVQRPLHPAPPGMSLGEGSGSSEPAHSWEQSLHRSPWEPWWCGSPRDMLYFKRVTQLLKNKLSPCCQSDALQSIVHKAE